MRGLLAAAALVILPVPVLARDLIRPAELPPADYAGLQYVDSRGCMFVRAGSGSKVVWIPRVSRQGVPVCGNPPSGARVPVAEEIGAEPYAPGAATGSGTAPSPAARSAASAPSTPSAAAGSAEAAGGYFVAIGSFGLAANADLAEARLRSMGHQVVRGRVQGGSSTLITVFAGPFADAATAAKAQVTLRGSGFPDATVMGR